MLSNIDNDVLDNFDALTKQMIEAFNTGDMARYNLTNNLRSSLAVTALEEEIDRLNKANKRS